MTLVDILVGQSVFIDSNIFVYALAPEPILGPPCFQFLERVRRGEITAVASSHVYGDVAHRLMTLEACAAFGWPYAGITSRLKRHPLEVTKLRAYRQALDEILAIGVQVLPVADRHIIGAGDLSRQHGLVSGDALVVALMQSHGLSLLASHDADFDRIVGITRFAPI